MRKSCKIVLVLLSMALVVAFTSAPTAFAEPKFKLNVGAGNDKKDKDKDKDKDDDNKNNNSNGNNNNNSNGNNSNNNSNGNSNSNGGKSNNSNNNSNGNNNSNNKQNNSNDNKGNGNSNSGNNNSNSSNNSNSNTPKQPQSIQDFLKQKNGQNQGNNNQGNNNQGQNNNSNKFNNQNKFPGQVLQNPNQVQNQNQNQNPNFKYQDNDKKNSIKFGVWNGDKWQGSRKAENWNKVFGHNQQLFSKQWYDDHPHAWQWDEHNHNHNHNSNVWVVATVPGMYQWLGWGDAPAQYRVGYNPGYRVDFSDYGDWYPLGVYSLMTGPDDMGTRVVQLAADRHGHLNGTYYDMITDNSYQISGDIQQQTQRAFWNLDKNPNVRFNAALFRLLQPEGSINVDLPGGQQRWQFVRLESDQQ